MDASIDIVVNDAIAARQSGDLVGAVALLEGAFEREPNNATVRVELATTLLQRDGLDLLDLDRISRFLENGTSAATRPASPSARRACAAASDPTAQVFDPADVEGFQEIRDYTETIGRAAEMLEPVIPDELQDFDICTSVADRALVYDQAAALADLRSQDLNEDQVAQALAVNALARFLDAYIYVTDELPEQTTWYRLADGSITICVDDESAVRAAATTAVKHIGESVLSLDARAAVLGGDSTAAEIVELAFDAYQDLRDAVADACDV